MKKTIICLALSYKNGAYCIAGIDEQGNWIRPVNKGGKELQKSDIEDKNGNLPKLLEIWEVEFLEKEPLYYQPENWVIDNSYHWEKVQSISPENLKYYCSSDRYIFRNAKAQIPSYELKKHPIEKSLMLIQVKSFMVYKKYRKKPQIRAVFKYQNQVYDLPITDISWYDNFVDPLFGKYHKNENYFFIGNFYFIIGLGEEYRKNHYKLIVGIISDKDSTTEGKINLVFPGFTDDQVRSLFIETLLEK